MGNSYHDNNVGNGSLGREAWLAFHPEHFILGSQQHPKTANAPNPWSKKL